MKNKLKKGLFVVWSTARASLYAMLDLPRPATALKDKTENRVGSQIKILGMITLLKIQ